MEGPSDGCPPPYATCTREADARERERYVRDLERLRDIAIQCQRWTVYGEDEAGDLVELEEDPR